jgi:hypothetical protein
VAQIPIWKSLQEKYQGQDVVFIAIHTAGTPMARVQGYQRERGWKALVALDHGDDVRGATVSRYGVRRFPTTVVIGRDGRVVFNTETVDRPTEEQSAERAARALSIPWPLNRAAPREVLEDQASRLLQFLYSEAIDSAIAKR